MLIIEIIGSTTARIAGLEVVDADVLEWFKAQGDDYEDRITAALQIYAEAHQRPRR